MPTWFSGSRAGSPPPAPPCWRSTPPLGWPAALAETLAGHTAGRVVRGDPHLLFRRDTDRFVKAAIGKQPLDVGADRIARTAHAALGLLGDVREVSGREIPLAWSPGVPDGAVAIEVYPAATLEALGIRSSGYKNRGDVERRREIIRGLAPHIHLPSDTTALESNADVLDAVVCAAAACDFLRGEVMSPEDRPRAEREGWIWVRRRSQIG
jgi:hypothetical protein